MHRTFKQDCNATIKFKLSCDKQCMVGGNRDEYYSTRRLDKDVNLDVVLFTCIELVHCLYVYTPYIADIMCKVQFLQTIKI